MDELLGNLDAEGGDDSASEEGSEDDGDYQSGASSHSGDSDDSEVEESGDEGEGDGEDKPVKSKKRKERGGGGGGEKKEKRVKKGSSAGVPPAGKKAKRPKDKMLLKVCWLRTCSSLKKRERAFWLRIQACLPLR
mmetsp:Transcript_93527/g.183353  ORF Transcript_93527/g.183353 Transcript_93527/m.183353 type:complete len:135 (-) Transcript_93527:310-714(-)